MKLPLALIYIFQYPVINYTHSACFDYSSKLIYIDGSLLRSLPLASWRPSGLLSSLGTAFITKLLISAPAWAFMLMTGYHFRRLFKRRFTSLVEPATTEALMFGLVALHKSPVSSWICDAESSNYLELRRLTCFSGATIS